MNIAMRDEQTLLRPRPNAVIAETMGTETMVIDTQSGVFYNLGGLASALWVLLESGSSLAALRGAVKARYPDEPGIDEHLAAFLSQLTDDRVLVPGGDGDTPAAITSGITSAVWPAIYAAPSVDRHDDLGDLLLVDPLHDVDARGWPHRSE